MTKVIEWVGAREGDIVWQYPIEEIYWFDHLIVHEYEAAVFFRDGKAFDVFRAGRHILSTQNIPKITKILTTIAGFDKTPFRATIVFVSLKKFQGKFGAQGQTKEYAPIKFYGGFWFRVEEPNLFVNEVVGGQSAYNTAALQEFLRGYFNERLIDTLSQHGLKEVFGKLDETSLLAKNMLFDPFSTVGLDLTEVKFEGIDTSEEWRTKMFYIDKGVNATEMLRMETVQKASESFSKSQGGAAVGAGFAVIPPLFQQQSAAPTQLMVLCPKCGFQNPQNQKFCGSCGATMQAPSGAPCPKCQSLNALGSKFCSGCGTTLAGTKKCPSCRKEVQASAKFCDECGAKI